VIFGAQLFGFGVDNRSATREFIRGRFADSGDFEAIAIALNAVA